MSDLDILNTLTRILQDLLLDDSIHLMLETKRDDVPNWSSFDYIEFIVAVELEFGMKFKLSEIESFENIGDIVKVVEQRK